MKDQNEHEKSTEVSGSRQQPVVMRKIHERTDVFTGLRVELFEAIGEESPFGVRLVDPENGDVGPQIVKFTKLSSAATFYEKHTPTW